jgi:hypothetical protein
MKALTNLEISRQDYVDSVIFKLIQSLNPTKQPIEWDIEMIGDIRDTIEDWIVAKMKICTEKDFYPYIEEENGNQRNSN